MRTTVYDRIKCALDALPCSSTHATDLFLRLCAVMQGERSGERSAWDKPDIFLVTWVSIYF
jgi:hypothetical protein